ncbi:MAG: laaA [Leifsonia sp.]|nr:laaA [Leifsonia sp.]
MTTADAPWPTATTEGTVSFDDGFTWYRVTGDLSGGAIPLVVLHGGPGCTHDYLLRLAALSEPERGGRPVVHYDQIGNGRSSHHPDRGISYWTPQLFLDELDNLLDHLGISASYDLLGQSWGGMLAAEHAVRRPAGLNRLVIADSPASMPLWLAAAAELRAGLPAGVDDTLRAHEAAGTTESPEYVDAVQVFYDLHVCRVVPNPPEVTRSLKAIEEDPTVYHMMNGPSEFHVVGSLKDWSIIDRLPQVEAPTLVVSGFFDEATPATVRPYVEQIPDVRQVVFAESAHMPHVEETERYLRAVSSFLGGNEPAADHVAG